MLLPVNKGRPQWDPHFGVDEDATDDEIISIIHPQMFFATFRRSLSSKAAIDLFSLTGQGRASAIIAKSPVSSHFTLMGFGLKFRDYKFIYKARLNLLPY